MPPVERGASPLTSVERKLLLRENLERGLDSIIWQGNFVSVVGDKADPDILVHDVGPINLPLSEAQAKELIVKAHQAPYGKGSQTIVDTSVRNTWEINPDQFQIRNPLWGGFVDTLLQKSAEQLGIHVPVSAEIYKMLLYEKGAMFKAHTDTEKIPGMFGTLVICLPSAHEGGEVILKHAGRTAKFRSSKFEMSAASWYSDVSHEVLPVTSGYRFVLTYNLAIDPTAKLPSATAMLHEQSQGLRQALESWSHEVKIGRRAPDPLYYVLDHKYTEANISLKALKTADKARVQCLQALCSELGFDVFLTTLEKMEVGTAEGEYGHGRYQNYYDAEDEDDYEDEDDHHDIEDITDTEHVAKCIFDLAGNKIVSSIRFDQDDVIQSDAFGDEPDEEDYEGYMGNSGPTATHWYRVSAVIILPSQGTFSFLTKPLGLDGYTSIITKRDEATAISNFYINRCVAAPRDEKEIRVLHRLLQQLWKPHPSGLSPFPLHRNSLKHILRLCLIRNEIALLDLILFNNKQPVPISFLTWLRGLDKTKVLWESIQKATCHSIQTQPTLSKRYQAIQESTEATEGNERLELLISRAVDDTFNTLDFDRVLSEEDGAALFNLSLYYRNGENLKILVSKIVKRRAHQISFLLGFLGELRQSAKRKQLPGEQVKPLYEDLSQTTLRNLSPTTAIATKSDDTPKVPTRKPLPSAVQHNAQFVNYVTPEAMIRFLSSLLEYDLQGHLRIFAERLRDESRFLKGEQFNTLWIPVFQDLAVLLERHKTPLTTFYWQQAYYSLLRDYLRIFVGKAPEESGSSTRQVSCWCGDCFALNRFLADPRQEVGRFPMGKGRRHHLHSQLDAHQIDCRHETERRGSPQTLVVTKTTKLLKADREKWAQRRLEAETHLRAFDQAKLRLLLGDKYEEITQVRSSVLERESEFRAAIQATAVASSSTPSPSSSTFNPHPNKRARTTAGASSRPTNPTAQQLAQLEAEIARSAGTAPAPSQRTAPVTNRYVARPIKHLSSQRGPGSLPPVYTTGPGSLAIPAATPPSSFGSRPPFRQASLNNGMSTWRGPGDAARGTGTVGSSPTNNRGSASNSAPQRRPVTTTTAVIGSKRKIVEVIDLTGDD